MPNSSKFALVPKQLSSPFFEVTSQGCLDRALKLGIECIYLGTEFPDVEGQAEIIRWLVDTGIGGIAVAVIDSSSNSTLDAIAYAAEKGVPLVTFDSDATNSKRRTFIGTDNFALGDHIGKVRDTNPMLFEPCALTNELVRFFFRSTPLEVTTGSFPIRGRTDWREKLVSDHA